ncbi:MAG: type II toxin-antitoxin system PemK/MazF family toxin [Candidatus Moeniiplasma glomeromycotorum]|nr:type II toxin-antitoxin system PemK/MazF family toxin [Candidatus Moeniiplasma glomeromycotorum]MCE8167389.1 type II toxin-antitoxin system PemK/MazF family toxin [Candidatus Moeniiplasma glomeromycotorum]MCE8168598.1 type II toxin-antitoxin system PemK/MazF family toxin [Candidatus Moeniiplasma glomeromycotorum]
MSKPKSSFPKKGEIWLLRNPERIKEIGKDFRPVLIVSNDERNEYDNSVVVLPTTTDDLENILLVEVYIENTPETGLDKPSKILCDSPFTWDKGIRFDKKLGEINQEIMEKVKKAWKIAFDSENW